MSAWIGLGSNLGDRREYLRRGLAALEVEGYRRGATSSIWESEPVDAGAGLWFLNMVAAFETSHPPRRILETLLRVEARFGRRRLVRNGPRTLDLDLLAIGDARLRERGLVVPHPRMWTRRFVLAPLAEVAPGWRHPRYGGAVAERLARLRDDATVVNVGPLL